MGIDPSVSHRVIGTEASIADDSGLRVTPVGVYEDLAPHDLLYIPCGGFGTRFAHGGRVLHRVPQDVRPVASVCTGALPLGRAGPSLGRSAEPPSEELTAPGTSGGACP
jgi:transcriptional regulator GlxA family with amidase domain